MNKHDYLDSDKKSKIIDKSNNIIKNEKLMKKKIKEKTTGTGLIKTSKAQNLMNKILNSKNHLNSLNHEKNKLLSGKDNEIPIIKNNNNKNELSNDLLNKKTTLTSSDRIPVDHSTTNHSSIKSYTSSALSSSSQKKQDILSQKVSTTSSSSISSSLKDKTKLSSSRSLTQNIPSNQSQNINNALANNGIKQENNKNLAQQTNVPSIHNKINNNNNSNNNIGLRYNYGNKGTKSKRRSMIGNKGRGGPGRKAISKNKPVLKKIDIYADMNKILKMIKK